MRKKYNPHILFSGTDSYFWNFLIFFFIFFVSFLIINHIIYNTKKYIVHINISMINTVYFVTLHLAGFLWY